MEKNYFQNYMLHSKCFGCGPTNDKGLKVKSYWDDGSEEALCIWQPEPHHLAGPEHYLNGGIICTVMDCHSICTAIANIYKLEERDMSVEPIVWCVTADIRVSYTLPTPIDKPVELRAKVIESSGKKSIVHCSLLSEGVERVKSEMIAIRVSPEKWYMAHGQTGQ